MFPAALDALQLYMNASTISVKAGAF